MATVIESLGNFNRELTSHPEVDLIPRVKPDTVIRVYPSQSLPDLVSPIEVEAYNSYFRVYKTPEVGIKRVIASKRPYLDPLFIEFSEFLPNLRGNEAELDSSGNTYASTPVIAEYWEDWKEAHPIVDEIYSGQIYPKVINSLEEHGIEIKSGSIVVDLFGGDGKFAHRLRESSEEKGEYHVIDGNPASLEKAREREGIIVHDVLDLTSSTDIFDGVKEPDLITAVGGLCVQVVTREKALDIAKKSFNQLKPGGNFIVTGYSYVLLSASDFLNIGFEVLNMSVPENILENAYPKQLYILRKPQE